MKRIGLFPALIASSLVAAGCEGVTDRVTNVTADSAVFKLTVKCGNVNERGEAWYSVRREETTQFVPATERLRFDCRSGEDRVDVPLPSTTPLLSDTRYHFRTEVDLDPANADGSADGWVDRDYAVNGTNYASFRTRPIKVAAGGDVADPDIADLDDDATADVIQAIDPLHLLALGDLAYDNGELENFRQFYDPSWGRFKSRTKPVPGNHEYNLGPATGYFDYFNGVGQANGIAGERGKGYYAFDVGTWRVYALNSEIAIDANSDQVTWLQSDLAANPRSCSLAFVHKPRFSGGNYTDNESLAPMFQVLYDNGVELVLSGHDHNYQRYGKLTPAGTESSVGVRQFVVGTGGRSGYALRPDRRREEGQSGTFGVLELKLYRARYAWHFRPIAGQTYADFGAQACH
jgi:hypothetical protein